MMIFSLPSASPKARRNRSPHGGLRVRWGNRALFIMLALSGCAHPRLGSVGAGRTLVFVGAHPDDEGLAGPVLSRACAERGARCVTVSLTRGEKGCSPGGPCGEELAGIRTAEHAAYAAHMGAKSVVLDYADGTEGPALSGSPEAVLAGWSAKRDARAELRALIAREKPDVVVTLEPTHGFYGHPDHRAAALLVTGLQKELGFALYYVLNRYASVFQQNLDPLPATETLDASERSAKLGMTYREHALEGAKLYKSQHFFEQVSRATEAATWARIAAW